MPVCSTDNKMKAFELNNISKHYTLANNTKYEVLKNVSFNADHGEFIAVMGPSGSGKSTLMHILGCLDTPSSGQYLIDGKDVSTLSDDQLSEIRNKEIGFVFQSFNLLPKLTILENVMVPFTYDRKSKLSYAEQEKRAIEVLTSVGLESKIHNKPNQISGGQVQRVAIARSLVMKPAVILADEPTGNLDSKTSKEIMELFTKLNAEGNTIILITHEEDIAEYAKRVINIKDGAIIEIR